MKTVEFKKRFISGCLNGIAVVERIKTDFPECWKVGNKGIDCITEDRYIIEESIMED